MPVGIFGGEGGGGRGGAYIIHLTSFINKSASLFS